MELAEEQLEEEVVVVVMVVLLEVPSIRWTLPLTRTLPSGAGPAGSTGRERREKFVNLSRSGGLKKQSFGWPREEELVVVRFFLVISLSQKDSLHTLSLLLLLLSSLLLCFSLSRIGVR